MNAWSGLIAIVVIGVLVLAIAAFVDRRSARRAQQALHGAAPIPGVDAELPAPQYTTADDVLRDRTDVRLSADEQAALDGELADPDALYLSAGLLIPELATHANPPRVILRHAKVLVGDRIASVREVLSSLERSVVEDVPVVLAATSIDPEVLDVLAVNLAQGRLQAAALELTPDELTRLAQYTGATALAQTDLQAGYVPYAVYGSASLLVIDETSTTVLTTPDVPDLAQR